MRKILILSVFCSLFAQLTSAEDLKCYMCVPVTAECRITEATPVRCGHPGVCTVNIRKESQDKTKAVRKCDISDSKGHIPCEEGFECHTCNTNLCTWVPPPPKTGDEKSSATLLQSRISWITVLMTSLYIVVQ